jgi:hypothetical protein
MQAGFVTRVEKNVDQAASVLFGVACGYSAYLWLGALGRLGAPVVASVAAGIALVAYLASFRVLSAVEPEARKLPVREFRLREVEPLEPEDFDALEPADFVALDPGHTPALLAAPAAPEPEELLLTDQVAQPQESEQVELLLTDTYEAKEVEEPEPAEPEPTQPIEVANAVGAQPDLLDDEALQFGPDSRVVRLFDAAAMPTPGQLGSRIDHHLHGEPAAMQSAEAAQALQDALAELRRSIPNRRG